MKLMIAARMASRASDVLSKECHASLSSLDHLVARVKKMAETLNPQDPGRQALDSCVETLSRARDEVASEFRFLSTVRV